jgi:sugar lactone lactonase YvrE
VVRAFYYDPATCSLANERVVIKLPEGPGKPDGMTIDREGNLWIALWNGWAVECWDPRSGECVARVDVPVARVTSCVFGGASHDCLFITTAGSGLSAAERIGQPLAGSIFCVHPGVSGYPAARFQGRREGSNFQTG